jgi:hypothetical protein
MAPDQPSSHLIRGYWNSQILNWSTFRYGSIGRLLPQSWPIRYRLKLAAAFVEEMNRPGDLWIDLGCGTGVLRQKLGTDFDGRYLGIDSSIEAINMAQSNFSSSRFPSQFKPEFVCEDVAAFSLPASRGVLALGLTDWISNIELKQILVRCRCSTIVISYTEKSTSSEFRIYKTFQFIKGFLRKPIRNSLYPISYSASEFQAVVDGCGWKTVSLRKTLFGPGRLAVLQRS